jgi:chromosome segregation ATPase
MIKNTVIIALIILAIYLYYQNKKLNQQSHFGNSGGTLFSFEEEQLKESNEELQTHLDQALTLQEANQRKMTEQAQEISNLKNQLNTYEGASGSGEDQRLKTALNERDELKRTNQNLELDKEELEAEVKKLKENKATSEDYEDLEAERDEAIRDKKTLEQEVLAINNRLNLKNKEVKNKEETITRIKKEFGEKDKSLNEKITEWKKKYNDKVKQLDEESSEYNKLEKENEKLSAQITELEKERQALLKPMPGEFPSDDESDEKKKKKNK